MLHEFIIVLFTEWNSFSFHWVENKIQPSKFEDLIGFIKQFMNQTASQLEGYSEGIVQNGRFAYKEVCCKGAIN